MKVPTATSEAQLEQLRREAEINGRGAGGAAAVIGVTCGAADPAAIDPSTAESAVPHRGHR